MSRVILSMVLSSVLALFVAMPFVQAEEIAATEPAEVVNVGNKICPISREEIPEELLGKVTTVYEGKAYNLCCLNCKKVFENDPEQYAAIAEADLEAKDAPEGMEGEKDAVVQKGSGMEGEGHAMMDREEEVHAENE